MQWIELLWEMFCEWLLLKAPMTLVLLLLTLIPQSECPSCMSHSMASSSAIASAQPMSLSSFSQLTDNCQAAQQSPMTMPIPQVVDAFTQISGSTCLCGFKECKPPDTDRIAFHHAMHSRTKQGMWCWAKSFVNLDKNKESGGRVEWPSLYMKDICWKEPWIDVQSFLIMTWLGEDMKASILLIILTHFFSGKETQWCLRTHKKPMYFMDDTKSWPLLSIGCQGTPRGIVISKTESKLKLLAN